MILLAGTGKVDRSSTEVQSHAVLGRWALAPWTKSADGQAASVVLSVLALWGLVYYWHGITSSPFKLSYLQCRQKCKHLSLADSTQTNLLYILVYLQLLLINPIFLPQTFSFVVLFAPFGDTSRCKWIFFVTIQVSRWSKIIPKPRKRPSWSGCPWQPDTHERPVQRSYDAQSPSSDSVVMSCDVCWHDAVVCL